MAQSRSKRKPEGQDAAAVALTAIGSWASIEARLAPIIGEDGFRVLFARSLHRARAEHPWLSRDPQSKDTPFAVLQASLASRTPGEAKEGGQALLNHFTELLHALIGAELAARLIGSV
jgi:hypothetical protein